MTSNQDPPPFEDFNRIRDRIEQTLAEEGLSPERAHDVAFHMLDWRKELNALHELYSNIDDKPAEEIRKVLIDFLTHAPAHVNAARFLYELGGVEDVFELGLLRGSSDPHADKDS